MGNSDDIKWVIRSHKWKDRYYSDKKYEKEKRTNNDIQNTTQKSKRSSNTNLTKTGVTSGAPEGFAMPDPHVTPVE